MLAVPGILLLTSCGQGSPRDGNTCRCVIKCRAVGLLVSGEYAVDYQERILGSCSDLGGNAGCESACDREAERAQEEANTNPKNIKVHDAGLKSGVKYVLWPVQNSISTNYEYHEIPESAVATWTCVSLKGECVR